MVKISSSVHVRLGEGLLLRKEILETALKTTELLQRLKEYNQENKQKHLLINKFKKDISELKEALQELEMKDLPRDITKKITKEEKPAITKTPKQIREEIQEEIEKPIIKSELERELDVLRSKIDNINI